MGRTINQVKAASGCANLGNVLTCTDSGLPHTTTYYYKVTAVSAIGESTQSSEASATTLAVAPSSPRSLTASPGVGQITLSWQAPADDGGAAATAYQVYRSTSSGTETLVTSGGCSGLGSVFTCTDSSLGNGATRYYKVTATNSAGEGTPSSEASATTFTAPTAPQSLTATAGFGQITLSWQAPTSNGGTPTTSYNVYRGSTSGGESLVTSGGCSGLGSVLTCTDSGFGNGATRYYKVTAVNAVGEGAQSSEAGATTFATPTAPQTLGATAGPGAGSIRLTWSAPSSNGGTAVTGYKVYSGPTSGSESLLATGGCSSLGVVLTCTDSGLDDGVTRYYKVSAVNAVGEGGQSNEASATTAIAPSAPQSLMATGGIDQVTLNWQPPASTGGSAITNYKVYRGNSSGGETLVTSGGCSSLGNTLTCTDSGCPALATCFYEVAAMNIVSEGPRSNEASATNTVANPCPNPVGSPGPGQILVVCGQGIPAPVGIAPQCSDGVDNNGDGYIDYAPAALRGTPYPGQPGKLWGDPNCTNPFGNE